LKSRDSTTTDLGSSKGYFLFKRLGNTNQMSN
jgi:hypothetical protein